MIELNIKNWNRSKDISKKVINISFLYAIQVEIPCDAANKTYSSVAVAWANPKNAIFWLVRFVFLMKKLMFIHF